MNLQINMRLPRRSNAKAGGPMGLEELTSYKWLGMGNGQIRTQVK
jgi:gamma-glutamyl phosphate reductase